MYMKKIKTNSNLLILFFIALLNITQSCSKKEDADFNKEINIPEGYAAINFDIIDISFEEESLGDAKSATVKIKNPTNRVSVSANIQTGMTCQVSLEPQSTSNFKDLLKEDSKMAITRSKSIDLNTHYRVYVYDKSTGELATSKNYIRGKEKDAGPLLVYGGKEYTIVAYSINSKSEFPAEIENATNINTATISNPQVEFMFQKQDIKIQHNSNNTIKLKFKHQFSQITTIIKLDNTTQAYASIRGANGASYIKPSYSKTKFKVSNGTISANNDDLNTLGSSVNFPFIPFDNLKTYSITSLTPTILNTPTSETKGTFTIETLTIGDVSRRVDINDLNLKPGVKYNLVLTFHVPETTIIGANPTFHFYDTTTKDTPFYHAVNLENPTFGAQIDIWYLDNSFNLNINGQNLFTKELNFEGFPLHDVYFSDDTYYGSLDKPSGNISVIYRINETAPRQQIPVVRLTIDENGNVKLFGRKRMSEGLRELNIRNTVRINPLAKLNPNGINKLTFSSTRWTTTDVQGRIYGIRVKTP